MHNSLIFPVNDNIKIFYYIIINLVYFNVPSTVGMYNISAIFILTEKNKSAKCLCQHEKADKADNSICSIQSDQHHL